ncbi:hypothetical protein C8J56DRAFT_1033623 [Mycena floridula]|nr:hypothetical protein C8J56DRAFT_1033623 [Mycena floridula]
MSFGIPEEMVYRHFRRPWVLARLKKAAAVRPVKKLTMTHQSYGIISDHGHHLHFHIQCHSSPKRRHIPAERLEKNLGGIFHPNSISADTGARETVKGGSRPMERALDVWIATRSKQEEDGALCADYMLVKAFAGVEDQETRHQTHGGAAAYTGAPPFSRSDVTKLHFKGRSAANEVSLIMTDATTELGGRGGSKPGLLTRRAHRFASVRQFVASRCYVIPSWDIELATFVCWVIEFAGVEGSERVFEARCVGFEA